MSASPVQPVADPGGWTGALRRRLVRTLPPEKLLPDRQPSFVASWIYVFGVLTIAALAWVVVSGSWLALAGPVWWHTSSVGHFVNSLHLWGVELFFFFMVVHLWGKFFMAAWRGRRALTWITGAVAFLGSVGTAFTGYLVQTNFDSQWISTQAKDGLNSVGVGAWFNVLNTGQMLLWHVLLLPLVLGVLVVWHVLLVRHRGVVPPFGSEETEPAPTEPERLR
jgi:ubiquinol-cytochrome c reductase cytochrome b subunit